MSSCSYSFIGIWTSIDGGSDRTVDLSLVLSDRHGEVASKQELERLRKAEPA